MFDCSKNKLIIALYQYYNFPPNKTDRQVNFCRVSRRCLNSQSSNEIFLQCVGGLENRVSLDISALIGQIFIIFFSFVRKNICYNFYLKNFLIPVKEKKLQPKKCQLGVEHFYWQFVGEILYNFHIFAFAVI